MKVKQLLVALQKADPEMDVCVFSDNGVDALSSDGSDVAVYKGEYRADMSPKLGVRYKTGEYVGLGCAGNFDVTAPCDVVEWIEDL